MAWWWLSFADGSRPKRQQFLGVVIVEGASIVEAAQRAWDLSINPGGEVAGIALPKKDVPPEEWRNRLLNRVEAEGLRGTDLHPYRLHNKKYYSREKQ